MSKSKSVVYFNFHQLGLILLILCYTLLLLCTFASPHCSTLVEKDLHFLSQGSEDYILTQSPCFLTAHGGLPAFLVDKHCLFWLL